MSFTVTSQYRAFKFTSLPLKNLNIYFKFIHLFSSSIHCSNHSSIDVEYFYTSLLEKSTRKTHLAQIHNQLYTHGMQSNGFIITKFIQISSNLNEMDYARQVFDGFPDPYVFLWNAIIRGYSKHNMLDKALKMYSTMQDACVSPDTYTLPNVLKACGGLQAVEYGRAVHAQIFRLGLEKDQFVQNGLLSFYVKCDEINRACIIINRMTDKNVVSWTLIISGYSQSGKPLEALKIFREMTVSYVKPDEIALVSVLKAYSDMEELHQGKSLHSLVIKTGHEFDPDIQISLISLYAKCGQILAAKSLFDQMKVEDVILYNAMISGFAKNSHANEALKLFTEMLSRKIQPDVVTIQSSILASAQTGSLQQARWMHNYVSNSNFKHNILIRTALIDMYAKCGSLDSAREVFNHTMDKDVVLWSAMIMGYALHGWGREAITLFNQMKVCGAHPNDVTFLGLITGCSHSGLVDEGWEIFHCMKDYGIEPCQKHYAGIVDLLGRAGFLDKAYDFVLSMPFKPGVSVWGALLSACKIHRCVTLGEFAAEKLFSLDPLNTGHYVQLSNLYASAGMWDGVEKVRVLMKVKGLNKDLGFAGFCEGPFDSQDNVKVS